MADMGDVVESGIIKDRINAFFRDCENCDSVEAMPEIDAARFADYPDEYTTSVMEAATVPRHFKSPEVKHGLAEFVFRVFFWNCDTVAQVIRKIARNKDKLARLEEVAGIALAEEFLPTLNEDLDKVKTDSRIKKAINPYEELIKTKYNLEQIYTKKEYFFTVARISEPASAPSGVIAAPESTPKKMATLAEHVLGADDSRDEDERHLDIRLRLTNQFDLAQLLKLKIDDDVIDVVCELATNNILDINQTPFGVLFDAALYAKTPLEDIVTLLLDLTNPAVAEVLRALRGVSFDELNDEIERFLVDHGFYRSLDSATKIIIPQRVFTRYMQSDKASFEYTKKVCGAHSKFKILELSMPVPGQVDWPTQKDIDSIQRVMPSRITIEFLRALRVVRQYEHEHPGCSDLLVFRILAAMPENCTRSSRRFMSELRSGGTGIDLATNVFVLQQYFYNAHYSKTLTNEIRDLFYIYEGENSGFNMMSFYQTMYHIKEPIPNNVVCTNWGKAKRGYDKKDFDVVGTIKALAEEQPGFREQCDVYVAALSKQTLLGRVVNSHRNKMQASKAKSHKYTRKNFIALLKSNIAVPWPTDGVPDNTILSSDLLKRIKDGDRELFANPDYRKKRIEALADVILKEMLLVKLKYGKLKKLDHLSHILVNIVFYREECEEAKELAEDAYNALSIGGVADADESVEAGPSGVDVGHAMTDVATAASVSGDGAKLMSIRSRSGSVSSDGNSEGDNSASNTSRSHSKLVRMS